jgi:hypothetical protein
MHTLYKSDEDGFYRVAQWHGKGGGWHDVFIGLSLIHAVQLVNYLNGGRDDKLVVGTFLATGFLEDHRP